MTLYAQWVPVYNVKYDANGGTGETKAQDNLPFEDKDVTVSENGFTRTGYSFVGWNTLENPTEENPGIAFGPTGTFNVPKADDAANTFEKAIPAGGEVTLYAQWDMWKYKIHYDGNGGEGSMPTQTFTYEDTSMLSLNNAYKRGGYNFLGFQYTDKNGNKTLYRGVNDFYTILRDLGPWSEITLVAQWEKIAVKYYYVPVTGIN